MILVSTEMLGFFGILFMFGLFYLIGAVACIHCGAAMRPDDEICPKCSQDQIQPS